VVSVTSTIPLPYAHLPSLRENYYAGRNAPYIIYVEGEGLDVDEENDISFSFCIFFALLGVAAKKAFSCLCFHVNSGKMEKI